MKQFAHCKTAQWSADGYRNVAAMNVEIEQLFLLYHAYTLLVNISNLCVSVQIVLQSKLKHSDQCIISLQYSVYKSVEINITS